MTRYEAVQILADLTDNPFLHTWEKQNKALHMATEALSADAVQGEWIDRSNGGRIKYPWWESCECNQCGGYGSGAYNFCPNCGADMRGEQG